LKKKIRVRQEDEVRAATKQELLIIGLVDGAIKRDPKATANLLRLLQSLGILAEAPEPTGTKPITDNDAEIIADFLRRHGATTETASSSENAAESLKVTPSGKEPKE
jgi:hypothetical protein